MFSELSKHELKVILDISYRCPATDTREDVVRILNRLHELIIFRSAAIAIQEKSLGSRIALDWINHSFSPEWIKYYKNNSYEEADPVLLCAQKGGEPFTWEEARSYAGDGNKKTLNLLHSAKEAGVYNGIAVSSQLKGRIYPKTIMAIDTGKEKIQTHWPLILDLILPHIHEALNRIKARKGISVDILCELSKRETETLKWAAEGKSAWEIGQIMGISERTIKFHFSNIFTKLNVVNRAQAVATGMAYGLI